MAETIPGGYFEGPPGVFHDANGKILEKRSESSLKSAKDEAKEAASVTAPGTEPSIGELARGTRKAKKAKR